MLALMISASMRGQYNPTNPAEPGVYYTLTLQATPAEGGSFNIGAKTSYTEGTNISLRAYTNSYYTFTGWEVDGEIISTSANITYTMPARHVTLIARYSYDYNPSNPAEPVTPVMPERPVYSTLTLSCIPAGAGSFNISSGNSYEVGANVSLRASANSNFKFEYWTDSEGTIISTAANFTYTMIAGNPRLVAHYTYAPSNPDEPTPMQPQVYRSLKVRSNPAGGGYFNVGDEGSYLVGSSIYLRAYNNQYYTFVNWTDEAGVVVSNSSSFNYTMPDANTVLTANYTYNYSPGNPGEPAEPVVKANNIYAATVNAVQGQTIRFPFYLENSTAFSGIKVDARFPDGFKVDAKSLQLSGRALGHSIDIVELGDNAYRIGVLSNTDNIIGHNGLVFEIPMTVSGDATMGQSYDIVLTHGVGYQLDGAQTPVSVRSGQVYVEIVAEDGLYAKYSFEKVLDRVKFRNLSSDKARRFLWDFGDGTTSDEVAPLHVYAAAGYYTVRLTAYGEYNEDVAESNVLINDLANWKVGGTFSIEEGSSEARSFATLQDLLAFTSRATISENMGIVFPAGLVCSYPLADGGDVVLAKMAAELSEGHHALILSKKGEGLSPVLTIGQNETEITPETIALFNSFAQTMRTTDVVVALCGIEYQPWKSATLGDQKVKSGDTTQPYDFSIIGADFDYIWQLTSTTDAEAVGGFLTEGQGVLPAMVIDNIDTHDWAFVYHFKVSRNGVLYYEFDKSITVIPASAYIDETEWQVLLAVRQQLVDNGWPTPWNISSGIKNAGNLEGVTVERGHIVGLDLSELGLQGPLPTAPFTLPRLTSYVVRDNMFTGEAFKDMLKEVTIWVAKHPDFVSRLELLDLSNNQFTGNVGLLASLSEVFPQLTTLAAGGNAFSEVSPMLPSQITTVDLGGQNTGKHIVLDFANLDIESLTMALPNIMTYNHQGQCYDSQIKVVVSDTPFAAEEVSPSWALAYDCTNGKVAVEGMRGVPSMYRGENGACIYVSLATPSSEAFGNYCTADFTFSSGDANYTDGVDVTDLQATILYAFGRYSRPFNFTAANTFADETINVQDVVCTVDLLLAQDDLAQSSAPRRGAPIAADAATYIYVDNDKVMLHADEPVAALCLSWAGDVDWHFADFGLVKRAASGKVVAYSLQGLTLPAGDVQIGTCRGRIDITSLTMADADAEKLNAAFVGATPPTSIAAPTSVPDSEVIYAPSGIRLRTVQQGINIIQRNGRTIKIMK